MTVAGQMVELREMFQPSLLQPPTVVWVKALDLLMDQLKITGLDFQDIRAISGAGQVSVHFLSRKCNDCIMMSSLHINN